MTEYYEEITGYRGKRDPFETVCTIRWGVVDVLYKMVDLGIEPTDENLDRILTRNFNRSMQDRSTEDGWETMQILIEEEFF